jgi:phthalate 4,5-dioxygenase
MLSAADSEKIVRVGPGTPMGDTMRLSWMPALLSSELPEPGCDPVHVELLGQTFVAFRDGDGNIGILDEMCCHRGVSLTVGRVEKCGLRCIYHGWLYAADGKILETPNVRDDRFKDRVRAKSYPVKEAGSMIWTYLGDPARMPKFPDYPFLSAPKNEVLALMAVVGCNYLHFVEGGIDSSHLGVLHSSSLDEIGVDQGLRREDADEALNFVELTRHMNHDKAPKIEAEETEFGFHYAAIRTFGDVAHTRITSFVAPFFVLNPNGDLWFAIVPMGDEKTAFYNVLWDGVQKYNEEPLRTQQAGILGLTQKACEEYGLTRTTFDGPNRMRRSNGWRQDRARMREGHSSGMVGFTMDDALMCVSGGPIRDRTKELLTAADAPIAQLYRSLLRSVRRVEEGKMPVGASAMASVAHIRGIHKEVPAGTDWRTLVPQHKQTTTEKNITSAA